MTPKRKKKLVLIVLALAGLGLAVGLGLNAFNQNIMFFFSPADVAAGKAPYERKFRIGGLVEQGSVQRDEHTLKVSFRVTDGGGTVPVQYEGILPDLFREGQGIVANGKLGRDGVFTAAEVLAKHDENYMPPEVADALAAQKASESIKN
ncbi:MAG: cytochrome c maturation protein CcmE [Gammaproteobacteria bacterium]|nr:cytochrome c maturation protein CcmE [Gammaproteobacteria bacterium]MCP5135636.1 cytochrome c maturation protein CcmE [Gammaproteobacteria bacterium]